MLFQRLTHPISVFHIEEFGVSVEDYLKKIKAYFFNLEWDWYLLRQKKLEFLISVFSQIGSISLINYDLFRAYYAGEKDEVCLAELTNKLSATQKLAFNNITSSRRRSIANFLISCSNDDIQITRVATQSFNQVYAQVSDEKNDWRTVGRVFKEAEDMLINYELYQIITGLTNKIIEHNSSVKSLELAVHFTQIISSEGSIASNSPEGIHQDGMDYIVSALVVDLENAAGGKSILYGQDKSTPLFETILLPGIGLFQPDKGTDLWHTVESITPKDKSKPAYRSSIGFDFSLNC